MIKFARYTYQGSEKTKIGLVLMSQTRFSAYSPLRRFYTFFYTEAFLYPNTKKASRQATDLQKFVEPTAGLEPATYALRVRCSTN